MPECTFFQLSDYVIIRAMGSIGPVDVPPYLSYRDDANGNANGNANGDGDGNGDDGENEKLSESESERECDGPNGEMNDNDPNVTRAPVPPYCISQRLRRLPRNLACIVRNLCAQVSRRHVLALLVATTWYWYVNTAHETTAVPLVLPPLKKRGWNLWNILCRAHRS